MVSLFFFVRRSPKRLSTLKEKKAPASTGSEVLNPIASNFEGMWELVMISGTIPCVRAATRNLPNTDRQLASDQEPKISGRY